MGWHDKERDGRKEEEIGVDGDCKPKGKKS